MAGCLRPLVALPESSDLIPAPTHSGLQPSGTPTWGDLMLSSGLRGQQAPLECTDIRRGGNTHTRGKVRHHPGTCLSHAAPPVPKPSWGLVLHVACFWLLLPRDAFAGRAEQQSSSFDFPSLIVFPLRSLCHCGVNLLSLLLTFLVRLWEKPEIILIAWLGYIAWEVLPKAFKFWLF